MLESLKIDLTFGLPEELVKIILVILFSTVIYLLIRHILRKMLSIRVTHLEARKGKTIISVIVNIFKYFTIIIDLLIILEILGISTSGFIASLGIVSLVAGLAAQDILKDFLGGLTILIENQYVLGDYITINGFRGEVVAMGLRSTKIKSYNGEVKIIANRNILEIINHSMEKVLAQAIFQVSYEADIEKVDKILTALCERLTNELPKIRGKVELWKTTDLPCTGIEYTMVVPVKYPNKFDTECILREEIVKELKKNKIKLPYDKMVIKNA